jgi:hypothetical protein
MSVVIERLGVEVTFSVPDWFGEGEDWEECKPPIWTRYCGNYAWERLTSYLEKHGLKETESCTHPQGQWFKLEFDADDMVQTGINIQVAHGLLVAFFMGEEERRAENTKDETDTDS